MSPKQMLPGQISPRQLASIKDGPINIPLRFGQNRVSNSWDIPDMDKSRQVKCCLNKCHRDSLNLFKMAQSTYLSYLSLIRLPVMSEYCALALIPLLMIRRRWRWWWRWRFHRDYIANSAQLNWDLAELGKNQSKKCFAILENKFRNMRLRFLKYIISAPTSLDFEFDNVCDKYMFSYSNTFSYWLFGFYRITPHCIQ